MSSKKINKDLPPPEAGGIRQITVFPSLVSPHAFGGRISQISVLPSLVSPTSLAGGVYGAIPSYVIYIT
jgi:hypothetical protein